MNVVQEIPKSNDYVIMVSHKTSPNARHLYGTSPATPRAMYVTLAALCWESDACNSSEPDEAYKH